MVSVIDLVNSEAGLNRVWHMEGCVSFFSYTRENNVINRGRGLLRVDSV